MKSLLGWCHSEWSWACGAPKGMNVRCRQGVRGTSTRAAQHRTCDRAQAPPVIPSEARACPEPAEGNLALFLEVDAGIQLSSFPYRRRLRSFQSPFLASIILESDRQVLWRPRK